MVQRTRDRIDNQDEENRLHNDRENFSPNNGSHEGM